MMKLLEALRRRRLSDDAGLSLIEVVIALLIFSVITLGSITAVGTVLGMTRDSRSRVVAANLASQAIDSARATTSIFNLTNSTTSVPLGGMTYTVAQAVSWISTTGIDSLCATPGTKGNGALLYKHVNVTVTWNNQKSTTQAVRADTIIAPTSKINDPSTGTILVSVTTKNGSGTAGVTATLAPDTTVSGNTATALTIQPSLTNSDGCAVATKVTPGTYVVSLATAAGKNDVDPDQDTTPSKTVTIAAGDSTGVSFSYDAADDYSMTYANYAGGVLVPSDLDTTILSTRVPYVAPTPDSDLYLYPSSAGYTFLAGSYVPTGSSSTSCLSPDPESWPKSSTNAVGHRPIAISADPVAKTASVTVPMGVVTVNVKNNDTLIRAQTTTAAGGDPGCAAGMTFNVTRSAGSKTATIALPYGTWAITSGTKSSNLSAVSIGTLVGSIIGALIPAASSTNIVTLDPRTDS